MKIKKIVRIIAEKIFQSKWYPNKKILLESVPDLSSQTYPVFSRLIEMHLNDDYKLIWLVDDKIKYRNFHKKNVYFVNYRPKNFIEKIDRWYLLLTSRAMLYSTRYIGKIFNKQLYVYLIHGTSLKSRVKHANPNEKNESDFCISLSHFFLKDAELEEKESHIPIDHFIVSGYPRNDYLFERKSYQQVLFQKEYNKVILWMPTFRQSKDGKRVDSNFDFPLGIPCLYSYEDCKKVNDYLYSINSFLVIKPHPAQDISKFKLLNLSNIKLIYDTDIDSAGIQLYQFIGSTDALITDYSSVYYDYLLTKKPIGITIDDLEEYDKTTGFCFDNILDILVGEHINSVESFIHFIQDVYNNNDTQLQNREKMCNRVHEYKDNHSTQRVCDLIINELNDRYESKYIKR